MTLVSRIMIFALAAVGLNLVLGYGAMVSFEVNGGIDGVERFVNALQCFTLAESLGGVESLVAHPATMTHASMDEAARATAGIDESLLRLSVGIEHADDLVADLRAALDVAVAHLSDNYCEPENTDAGVTV